ncbi:MAG: M23 family metallopeptidase [Rhodoglobus sp.]
MKKQLTICAVFALVMSISVPASVLPGSFPAATAAVDFNAKPKDNGSQALTASAAVVAPTIRDVFGITAPPPPPPVRAAPKNSVSYTPVTGSLANWPANASVNDGFGYRDGGEFHGGIDIMASYGSTIVASSPGTVIEVTQDGGWGQYVQIDHGNGVTTLSSHMISGSPTVSVGQTVGAGEQIGLVGDTGYVTVAHLHFEVWVNGTKTDPMAWLP